MTITKTMTMTKTKSIFLCLMAAIALASCQKRGQFHVEGHITGAADTMLYLEHLSLAEGAKAVDSVRLKEDGEFQFSRDTIGNPEFYRLRIGGQCINLAFDSTETVQVEAQMKDMSFGYKVSGSGVCDTIRLLTLKLADLERSVMRVSRDRSLTLQQRAEQIDTLLEDYKDEVKMEVIQNRYGATYSYFACFQMLGGQMVFNPMQNKGDLTWMRAVANAWAERYPDSQRAINLSNIILQGRRNHVQPRQIYLDLDDEKVTELGIIDMTYPDIKGNPVTLSSLRGKVVLLDFTAFSLPGSQERTLELRELYNRYHDRGLEIYQVSCDPDRHFWTQRVEELPWVSVFNEEGITSDMLQLYQVQGLPTFFLIDRNCDLHARMEQIPDLRKAIESLL